MGDDRPSLGAATQSGYAAASRIVLLTPPTLSHRTAEETLALGYLASVLRVQGYEVTVVDSWLEGLSAQDTVDKVMAAGDAPHLAGISCYRSNLTEAKLLLHALQRRFGNIPVICGGYGPTFQPKDFLEVGFSVAVIGEAETTIVQLARALLAGTPLDSLRGIAFMRGAEVVKTLPAQPVHALDSLPFPARDNVARTMAAKNFVHVSTSRGCLASCNFCSVFAFELIGSPKHRWRGRSIDSVVEEVSRLHHDHGAAHFKFVDDSFIEPPRDAAWARALCEAFERRGLKIRFRTQIRADRLTEPLVKELKSAGWLSTSVGVENAAPSALRRMGKAASQANNLEALRMLNTHGVYVQMGMILFDPQTTLSELHENLAFLTENPWPITKGIFTEMFAAEGTSFTRTLRKRRALEDRALAQNHVYKVRDVHARRAYNLLRAWHRSHSVTYDWTIDAISAPKVLPDDGYARVHRLCGCLKALDLAFFTAALAHIDKVQNSRQDADFVDEAIAKAASAYDTAEQEIAGIYRSYGLTYDAAPNPFIAERSEMGVL